MNPLNVRLIKKFKRLLIVQFNLYFLQKYSIF